MPSGVYKRTPEHGAAISKALSGVPKSPEHIAAIKKALKNSDGVKAANDAKRGVPRTRETCAKMSISHTSVPLSPEHIAAMSEGLRNSDANKEQIESMFGGYDLVTHHYRYDHSDLSLNTVQMTRKDHSRLHMLLRRLGYKVPHINVKEVK